MGPIRFIQPAPNGVTPQNNQTQSKEDLKKQYESDFTREELLKFAELANINISNAAQKNKAEIVNALVEGGAEINRDLLNK